MTTMQSLLTMTRIDDVVTSKQLSLMGHFLNLDFGTRQSRSANSDFLMTAGAILRELFTTMRGMELQHAWIQVHHGVLFNPGGVY